MLRPATMTDTTNHPLEEGLEEGRVKSSPQVIIILPWWQKLLNVLLIFATTTIIITTVFTPSKSTVFEGDMDMRGHRIHGLPTPIDDSEVTTLGYLKNELPTLYETLVTNITKDNMPKDIGIQENLKETAADILRSTPIIGHRWMRTSSGVRRKLHGNPTSGKKNEYDINNLIWMLEHTRLRCFEIDALSSADGVLYCGHRDNDFADLGIPSIHAARSEDIDAVDAKLNSNSYGRGYGKILRVDYVLGIMMRYNACVVLEVKYARAGGVVLWRTTMDMVDRARSKHGYPKRLFIITAGKYNDVELREAKKRGYITMATEAYNDPYDDDVGGLLSPKPDKSLFDMLCSNINTSKGKVAFPSTENHKFVGLYDSSGAIDSILPYTRAHKGSIASLVQPGSGRFIYSNSPELWANELYLLHDYYPTPNPTWLLFDHEKPLNLMLTKGRGNQWYEKGSTKLKSWASTYFGGVDVMLGEDSESKIGTKIGYFPHLRETPIIYAMVQFNHVSEGEGIGIFNGDGMFFNGYKNERAKGYLLKVEQGASSNYTIKYYFHDGKGNSEVAHLDRGSDTGIPVGKEIYLIFSIYPEENGVATVRFSATGKPGSFIEWTLSNSDVFINGYTNYSPNVAGQWVAVMRDRGTESLQGHVVLKNHFLSY